MNLEQLNCNGWVMIMAYNPTYQVVTNYHFRHQVPQN